MTAAELYVLATPLGNRGDITLRAIECLKAVPWIFAEDTRETAKLLRLCGIDPEQKKIHSYASHNLKKATALAVEILEQGQSMALVTDRGTPAVSDPGALLVAAAREAGVKVLPVPGPSSVTAALSVAGLTSTEFFFAGFFPRENKERKEWADRVQSLEAPTVFFESARRVRETAMALKAAFAGARLFIAREMTKVFEEYLWFDLDALDPAQLSEQGEYVVVLVPGPVEKAAEWHQEVQLRAASDRDWSKQIAARHGVAARDVYNALQQQRGKAPS